MKRCTHEQGLLLAIHGEATLWENLQLLLHCNFCESCRQRKQEFVAASRALTALRPVPAIVGFAPMRPMRKRRLILCSALVALAAAAVSYYFSFGPIGGSQAKPTGDLNSVSSGHCGSDTPGSKGGFNTKIPQ